MVSAGTTRYRGSNVFGLFSNNNHADLVVGNNLKIDGSHDLVTIQNHGSKSSALVYTGNGHTLGAGAVAIYLGVMVLLQQEQHSTRKL